MNNSLLLLGHSDTKLKRFLIKLGYNLLDWERGAPISRIVESEDLSLILLDANIDQDSTKLAQLFRNKVKTQNVPIVYLSKDTRDSRVMKQLGLNNIDVLDAPYSRGAVVSRIVAKLQEAHIFVGADSQKRVRTLHQILVPRGLPEDSRFDLAGSYEPLHEIGGDLYFVHEEDNGKITIMIADVTGHDHASAFMSGITKLTMCATETESPNELLRILNRVLAPQIPEGSFVTAFCLIYDPDTGAAHCSRAGHPPSLHFRRQKQQLHMVKGEGFPLGFFPDSTYDSEIANLEVGDILVTFTDGYPEAKNAAGDTYGYEQMMSVLFDTHPDDSAQDVLDALRVNFDEFCQGIKIDDDLTMMVLKRR